MSNRAVLRKPIKVIDYNNDSVSKNNNYFNGDFNYSSFSVNR
jgi:hypothetical protein